MPTKDPRIDAYIAAAQPFARPILKRLRAMVHQACPEAVETIKWGFASFDHKGPLCSMAAFKAHAVFGFWKYKLLRDPAGCLGERANKGGAAMGNLGRLTSVKDLPDRRILLDLIRHAKALNDAGVKAPQRPKRAPKRLVVPVAFRKAVSSNAKARAAFAAFSPSAKREYVEWYTEAKTDDTRARRLRTAVSWMSQGKQRNWKYQRK
jgi:hypothetical protein